MDHLYFVVHTHWDREWYQPFQRMRARLLTMTNEMLAMLESGRLPCFHFDGQTVVLEDYLEVHPEDARRIARLVKAGRLQIGPWYLLADSFIPSGEALIRNLEIGARIARRFGAPATVGYLPDQFGHAAQVPQILAGFGLKTCVVFRGVPRDVKRNRFAWEALDGTSILAAFLPFGYFNGANLPTDSAAALLARAGEIAAREREFAAGAPILVMNGSDHVTPDPRLQERLAELNGNASLSFEIGTLENYARKIADLPADGTPRHRGQLRSPARSNLTPGVTSVRAWIKQRDFHNSYLLEKIADPLAALAAATDRARDSKPLLDLAWRTAIQNHPHDSICGCSVDQVHQDMRYRFDQVAMIAETVVREAHEALFAGQTGEPALAGFNPTFARKALIEGEAEIADPDARFAVLSADGRRLPAAIDIARRARSFEVELPAVDFKGLVSGAQVMGQYVHRFELRRIDDAHFALDLLTGRRPSPDLDPEDFRRRIHELPDAASIRIHATAPARAQIAFVDDAATQAGFSSYRIAPDEHAPSSASPSSGDSIENEFFRLSPSARGLRIEDLVHGKELELHFEDDADRGDEYNFDPVADARPLTAPASIVARVLERGPVRSRLTLSVTLRLPKALTPDRRARAEATVEVPIELLATTYATLERVDFEATVDNRARDHRLRIALTTPVSSNESLSDTNFGVVRRALDPQEPAGVTEDVYPTAPHRTFTAVESPELSVALMSRGILETEVRRDAGGTTILLTLLRCVGWLSRGDLEMRRGDAGPEMQTPDAQEIGRHRFEFALTTWRGSYAESDRIQRIQTYAYPPRVFAARSGADVRKLRFCECDNPRVVFSTARAADRAGAYLVRVFSASPDAETARFRFGEGRRARLIDLARRPVKDTRLRRLRDGSVQVTLRPFQIATFEIRATKQ